ncbi:MAG: hypothetical protein ACXVAB_14535 [Thermodesulfobacteriota bacterium]
MDRSFGAAIEGVPMKPKRRDIGRNMMGHDGSENRRGASNRKTMFDPGRYGMVICPDCKGMGYIQNAKRQCCPKCGGFGFIKKKLEKNPDTSPPEVPDCRGYAR